MDVFTWSLPFVGEKITDMLVAVLNTCTKEELEESDEDTLVSPTSSPDSAERRKIIKGKILAVGRMARVFALLREESEKVSELKSVSGSNKLPYGTLALGSEGIKDAITGFEDARKSDIENERLPPDLFDAEEGKTYSQPQTPTETYGVRTPPTGLTMSPAGLAISPTGLASGLESAIKSGSISPSSPASPVTPTSPGGMPFKRGHGRQASLGTTRTSPSTRRRSIETTISMIQEAYDGKEGVESNPATGAAGGLSGLNGNRSGSGGSSPRG